MAAKKMAAKKMAPSKTPPNKGTKKAPVSRTDALGSSGMGRNKLSGDDLVSLAKNAGSKSYNSSWVKNKNKPALQRFEKAEAAGKKGFDASLKGNASYTMNAEQKRMYAASMKAKKKK